MNYKIKLTVNGQDYECEVESDERLVDVLRERLDLTGTKIGCEIGVCGTCSVLVDNKIVNSCLMLAVQADGKNITTIEGIADGDKLHPLQKAFIEHGAVQCGFCTPGMVIAGKALLDENKNLKTDEGVKVQSDKITQLEADNKKLSTEIATSHQATKTASRKASFDKMFDAHEVCEAQRAPYMKNDMDAFLSAAQKMNPTPQGGTGDLKLSEGEDVQDKVLSMANELMKEKKFSMTSDAIDSVLDNNPELAKAYNQSFDD